MSVVVALSSREVVEASVLEFMVSSSSSCLVICSRILGGTGWVGLRACLVLRARFLRLVGEGEKISRLCISMDEWLHEHSHFIILDTYATLSISFEQKEASSDHTDASE